MQLARFSVSFLYTAFYWTLFCGGILNCDVAIGQVPSSDLFSVVDNRLAGVAFEHTNGQCGQHYVIEPYSAGLAIFDYDGDGWQDIYFVNGHSLCDVAARGTVHSTNHLYRNLGGWRFEDVTDAAGVGDGGYGLGCVAGDIDNDGDADLYVSNYGSNVLFINNGDGTFSDQTESMNVVGGKRFSAGVVFLDIENDGDLDLYCGNYQKFSFDQHVERIIGGLPFHPGPADYPPDSDLLFKNLGDGRFADISDASGISQLAATSMGALAADFDRDGDTDLFVGNDSQPNFYFVNDGTGVFTEDAVFSGVAYDRSGTSNGNMGVECRDINADGELDLVCTTYQDELPVLYQNQGDGFFDDLTNLMNIDRTLYPHVNWGLGLEDFNKDTNVDLFIACGHFMDNIHAISDATQMKVKDYVQFGGPTGKLVKASSSLLADAPVRSARGAAFADLDGDGDQDVIVLNANDKPTLLNNRIDGGNWLQVRLIGMHSNRDAAGALIQCEAAGKTQVAAVHLGRGYQSHYGQEVFFGLGKAKVGSNVTVRVQWPYGNSTEFGVKRTNCRMTCFESGLIFEH